jgi:hypothetical protein
MAVKFLLGDVEIAFGTLTTVFSLHESLFDLAFPSIGRALLSTDIQHVIQEGTWIS